MNTSILMRRGTLLLISSLFASCQFSENRYLMRTVEREELVGSWRATESAIKSLRAVGVQEHLNMQDHILILQADGSWSFRSIMSMPIDGRVDYRNYVTGCRWRLGSIGHQALQLELTPPPASGSPYYYFAEEHGRLLLWQYVADPDAWQYIEFEKGA